MYRIFFKLMGGFFVCSIIHLIAPMPSSEAESQTQSATGQSNYKLKPKANHGNGNKALILVPPPPPEQPSLLDWSGLSGMPDSISYLNADELSVKLDHVRKQITNAKLQVKDDQSQLANKKDRAERFDALYAEGVVSRKELQVAKKDVTEIERLLDEEKNDLTDLELQEGAIVRQLNLRKRKSKTPYQSHQTKIPRSPRESERKSK